MPFYITGYNPSWGSHIPVLIDVLNKSQGPVLELGLGIFSTPLLHALCLESNRMLVSYENDKQYFDLHSTFVNELHQIKLVEDWDKAEIEKTHWGMAFVDHRPAERRKIETKRLINSADYIVVHDSEPYLKDEYQYDLIYSLFKFRRDYVLRPNYAYTTVLSNFKDLTELKQPQNIQS